MRTGLKFIALLVFLVGIASVSVLHGQTTATPKSSAVFTEDGSLVLPTGYRKWLYIGGTVTPQGLNRGHAGFPEFHNVYVEEWAYDAFRKNGEFPEGTVICKELNLVLKPTHPDGSQDEASGRGYFQGRYNGLDVMVKDSKRFAKTGNWGFFNFGHHALPYAGAAKEGSKEECAGCHIAGAGKTDSVWVQFYPVLTGK